MVRRVSRRNMRSKRSRIRRSKTLRKRVSSKSYRRNRSRSRRSRSLRRRKMYGGMERQVTVRNKPGSEKKAEVPDFNIAMCDDKNEYGQYSPNGIDWYNTSDECKKAAGVLEFQSVHKKVVGSGNPMFQNIIEVARQDGGNTGFLGKLSEEELNELYSAETGLEITQEDIQNKAQFTMVRNRTIGQSIARRGTYHVKSRPIILTGIIKAEQELGHTMDYFHASEKRNETENLLDEAYTRDSKTGHFLLRFGDSHTGYTLCVKKPNDRQYHYKIIFLYNQSTKGRLFHLEGGDIEKGSLSELIASYGWPNKKAGRNPTPDLSDCRPIIYTAEEKTVQLYE